MKGTEKSDRLSLMTPRHYVVSVGDYRSRTPDGKHENYKHKRCLNLTHVCVDISFNDKQPHKHTKTAQTEQNNFILFGSRRALPICLRKNVQCMQTACRPQTTTGTVNNGWQYRSIPVCIFTGFILHFRITDLFQLRAQTDTTEQPRATGSLRASRVWVPLLTSHATSGVSGPCSAVFGTQHIYPLIVSNFERCEWKYVFEGICRHHNFHLKKCEI